MITKKLGKIMFGWDPTANKGKGYWYVLGRDDSFSRAASRGESSKLGVPKASESPKKEAAEHKYYYDIGKTGRTAGKPVRRKLRTGSDYEENDITRSKSLGQLASERMMKGEGLGASLKSAMKDKIGAKSNALKKKFDPMNMLSKLPGGMGTLAATAWGKMRKRDPKDISYFTGIHAPDKEEVPQKEKGTPTASKIGGKSGGGGGLGRGSVGILREIKQTIVDKFEEDKKQKEVDKSFEEEKKTEEDKKHKELIDAILHGLAPKGKKDKKEEKKSGIMDMLSSLGMMFSGFFGKFANLATSILSSIGGVALKMGKGVLTAGKNVVKAGGNLAIKAAKGAKSGFSAVKSALGFGSKAASAAPKALNATKSALTQAKPGTVSKIAETAEKAGSALAKGGKTATKLAGAGSKLLQGGSKLLGFVKAVPGLSLITAGADLVMRLKEVNDLKEAGKLSDAEYKKELVKAIGDAAAAGLLPALGAAVGSVVPGVGTVVGGLAGAGAALMGGDKIGGWLAGKMYDYFVDGKKGSEDKAGATSSKPTATPVSSPSTKSTGTSPSGTPTGAPGAVTATQPTAKPTATPPSNLGGRFTQATQANQNLTGPAAKQASSPTIINKSTNIANSSSGSGGGAGGGVRNDESILQRVQFGNMRAV